MKTPKDLIPDDPQQLIESSKRSQDERQSGRPSEQVMERLWINLAGTLGSSFVSQYGEEPNESWARLLTGITTEQIASGLSALKYWSSDYCPNAVQFAALCEGRTLDKDGHDITHHHKSAAYIDIHDPKSPAYRPKMIEDLKSKDKNAKQGNETFNNLKGLFK